MWCTSSKYARLIAVAVLFAALPKHVKLRRSAPFSKVLGTLDTSYLLILRHLLDFGLISSLE